MKWFRSSESFGGSSSWYSEDQNYLILDRRPTHRKQPFRLVVFRYQARELTIPCWDFSTMDEAMEYADRLNEDWIKTHA